MTKWRTVAGANTLKSKLVGLMMIVAGFAALALDFFFGGGPISFGVVIFCSVFVYGLAKLRNKQ